MEIIDFSERQCVAASVRRKACRLYTSWRDGKKVCKRLQENGYLKMDIGPFWRMLSKDGGQSWLLMSHQDYNREIRK
jgi:Fe-S-cluster containining protein